jgi:hypothetical protein
MNFDQSKAIDSVNLVGYSGVSFQNFRSAFQKGRLTAMSSNAVSSRISCGLSTLGLI